MEHIPPPAYSVTDPALSPTALSVDNASTASHLSPENDAASSIGDPTVFTPIHSPDGSCYLNDPDPISSPAAAAAAAAYFESRPVLELSTDSLLVHEITVTERTQLSDLEFPEPEKKWLARDVLPQDWETFINYLIPHHADISNSEVADRKLKAELIDERMNRLTLDDNDRSRTDLDKVSAQLEPLRQSYTEHAVDRDAGAIITQWNEGFFGPRGVFIDVMDHKPEDDVRAMPGSWTNDPAEPATQDQAEIPQSRSTTGFGNSWVRADSSGFHIGRNLISADNNGFRIGSTLVADNSGFRIGNLLVADRQGFKVGPIRADSDGFRIGGGDRPRQAPQEHHRAHHLGHHHVQMRGMYRGRHQDRNLPTGVPRERSQSRSSSSSSDSSASDESVGSLPSYDHLEAGQLPIAERSIKEWLAHPEQPITKEAVKQITQEIKAAKSGNKSSSETDLKALRQEVREMFKEFKTIKKSQKHQRRSAKHERRMQKRELKRGRKAARRHEKEEARNARAEAKREMKNQGPVSLFTSMRGNTCTQNPPGAWPLASGPPPISHPPHYMHSGSPPPPPLQMAPMPYIPPVPSVRPMFAGRGWPSIGHAPTSDNRSEAERMATSAREQAEQNRQQAQVYAASVRETAQAYATEAQQWADDQRQRAQAKAERVGRKIDASRMQVDAVRMQSDATRMRTQAAGYDSDNKTRLRILDAAEKLEEKSEKLMRDAGRMMAEAVQAERDGSQQLPEQENGVVVM